MDKAKIYDIIHTPACLLHMDEKVIAFASGEMKDVHERILTLAHIASCDHCRYLIEDYYALESIPSETTDQVPTPELHIRIDGEYLVPVTTDFIAQYSAAQVLGNKKISVVEFNVPFGQLSATIKAIRSRVGIDLEIRFSKPHARFYLIGSTGYALEHPQEGVVRFYNVRPGRYALSPEMQEFVFLEIQ